MAPDVLLVLKAGCCKDAVDFGFVRGRTFVPVVPRGSNSLVLPANN